VSRSRRGFSVHELATLRAAVDVAIPPDDWPGGWEGGVRKLVETRLDTDLLWLVDAIPRAIAALDSEAARLRGLTFVRLTGQDKRVVFESLLDDGGVGSALHVIVRLAFEGYYAGPSPAGWDMVGYRPVPEGVSIFESALPTGIDTRAMRPSYDVVVIGAGAGGGTAGVLAEAGAEVLLIECSRAWPSADLRGDHLRGKRLSVCWERKSGSRTSEIAPECGQYD
jgi:hypothetical protein